MANLPRSDKAIRHNQREFRKFQKALGQAVKEVDDLSPVLSTIADRFRQSRKFIFDRNRVSSGQYADLSPWYKAWKTEEKGTPYPILLLTGRLKKSITKKGRDHIEKIGRKSLILGTKVPYGFDHQKGKGRMPARPFLFWGPEAPRWTTDKLTTQLHKDMAYVLIHFVERMAGKTLDASHKRTQIRVRRLFK